MTFEDQPELYRLADSYRSAVAAAPTATLIPDQWLHLTVQGIGFTDETSDATLGAVIEEAGKQLAQLPAVAVEFGAIVVADEAIVMPALPVQRLRAATRTEPLPGPPSGASSVRTRSPRTPADTDLTSALPT
ncbi:MULTISPECIES: hypothetical protein [Micromonospora]|uniref:hypothetical protein n=1 Tax=Micromonospora TaxID=1873 RepID=UPI0006744799|nr:hypothetical protein [Micromonospora sp. L5]